MDLEKPKIGNPLTVIAIFASLAETVSTSVLPLLDKDIQQIFVYFVMFFPILLVLLFFLTLNFNQNALYAPKDFSKDSSYIEAQRINSKLRIKNVETREKEIIEEKNEISKIAKNYGLEEGIANDFAEKIKAKIESKEFIFIDMSSIGRSKEERFIYSDYNTFNILTDDVYFKSRPTLPAFTYGKVWALKNQRTNKVIKHKRMSMGGHWGESIIDDRPLDEVDINPGDKLILELYENG